MPLNQTQHGEVNWGAYAERHGWHSIEDPRDKIRLFCIKEKVVPYGSYVTYRDRFWVETQEQFLTLMRRYYHREDRCGHQFLTPNCPYCTGE